jgi:hypothetical protein
MKSSLSPHSSWIALLLLSSLAFGLGFGIAYQQDKNRVAELGSLAWFHLLYAQEMKDDMAVIDGSKNLENLGGIRAFQVQAHSKSIAEGGNRDYLARKVPEGITYFFPADWIFRSVAASDPQNPRDFTLVYHSQPGPWLWGLLAFFASFLTGVVLKGLAGLPRPVLSPGVTTSAESIDSPVPTRPDPILRPFSAPNPTGKPFLFIDKNYVIQQADAAAAGLLKKSGGILTQGHLLDLNPDPLLIQAIEKADETKIATPFPDHPHLSVLLKPDSNGSLLILESAEGA